jgi:dTDP-4-dehydrorhamnose 3,5-epimerase
MGRQIHCAHTPGSNLLMIFTPTPLHGAYVIEPERLEDHRGFFARTWCVREFEACGLEAALVQCSTSFNKVRGTLRGLHYQAPPYEEDKLVRCTMGSIYEVIVDLRPDSPSNKKYFAVILSAKNRKMVYVPKGLAHGFQTLEDNTEVFYQISEFYEPAYARGVRWNDPAFGITWPIDNPIMNERDRTYSDFRDVYVTHS